MNPRKLVVVHVVVRAADCSLYNICVPIVGKVLLWLVATRVFLSVLFLAPPPSLSLYWFDSLWRHPYLRVCTLLLCSA